MPDLPDLADLADHLTAAQPWPLLALGAVLVVLLVVLRGIRSRSRRRRPGRRPGRRSSRTAPQPGEVWFALVPYEDGTGAKDRPVLVLAAEGRTCTIARLTSQDKDGRGDFARVPPGVPGLHRASWISLRPQPLPRAAFRRRVGDPGPAFVAWYRTR